MNFGQNNAIFLELAKVPCFYIIVFFSFDSKKISFSLYQIPVLFLETNVERFVQILELKPSKNFLS